MVVQALLVALVYYVCSSLSIVTGVFHLNRPIILAPLVGLVLGDLQTGIILGAMFEAVFLGVIAIGGSMPADAAIGSVFGAAVAIIGGLDPDTALAVAMPVSILGLYVSVLPFNILYPIGAARAQKHASEGNFKGVTRMALIMGVFMYFFNAIVVFLGVQLGAEALGNFLGSMPGWVMSGLGGAGKILPAIGMALLLNMLFDKKVVAFFFLGFVLSIYLGLPSIAIAVIAVVIGIYTYFNMPKNNAVPAVPQGSAQFAEEEEFFE